MEYKRSCKAEKSAMSEAKLAKYDKLYNKKMWGKGIQADQGKKNITPGFKKIYMM